MTRTVKKLILLDVHAILHRAYHALPGFVSSRGEPTGALYGLSAFLIKVIAELEPDYLVACYDLPGPTFRKKVYDEYKAGRPKADTELVAQMIRSRDIFQAFNIPIYEKAGFEADDIIGTIADKVKKEKNLQTVIASGDMDTLQLVSGDSVVVYTLKKGLNDTVIYNERLVKERFGFGPELLPDYKGLRGDPSDNIIGVKGVGEKTATELIKKFGSIDELYKKLRRNPAAFLAAGIKPRMVEILKAGEEEATFSRMLATISRDAPIDFSLPEKSWREGFDAEPVLKIFRELEFKTLGPRLQSVLHEGESGSESETRPGANSPYVSERTGLVPDKPLLIAAWLLNSELVNPTAEDVLTTLGAKNLKEAEKKLPAEIKDKGLALVYYEIELPIIPIIKEAEELGLLIDKSRLQNLSKEYHRKLAELGKKIWEMAGEEFNINSPKQLGVILFDKLKLAVKGLKKTPGGGRSTREAELLKLRDTHPIIEALLSHREIQKLLSTYIDPLPGLADKNGRLHTSLNQMGTTTGRLSSSNPNLQNIPAGGEAGREIRRAFIAPAGSKLAAFDYSQIEMRVLAWLSGDEELTEIFKKGEDIHTAVAAKVFNVAEADVTREMRRKAKVINFGILYGMGVSSLKKNLGSTMEEAQNFYDNFFAGFPKIKNYFEKIKNQARQNGYTTTAYGRRRYFPMINSSLPYVRAEAERMAVNAVIQGTATADIIKMAMRDVDKLLKETGFHDSARLVLQVHDELLYEIKDDENLAATLKLIKETMERVGASPDRSVGVPIVVNAYVGDNWGEMKKV